MYRLVVIERKAIQSGDQRLVSLTVGAQINGRGRSDVRRVGVVIEDSEITGQEGDLLTLGVKQLGLAQGVGDDHTKALVQRFDVVTQDHDGHDDRRLTGGECDGAARDLPADEIGPGHAQARVDAVVQRDHALNIACTGQGDGEGRVRAVIAFLLRCRGRVDTGHRHTGGHDQTDRRCIYRVL